MSRDGKVLDRAKLSSKLTTDASMLGLRSHEPVFDVPKTLARVGQRRYALSLDLRTLCIQVVGEIQEHDGHLFRDRLEHGCVEVATRGVVKSPAGGLEIPVDRQGREAGEVVARVGHLGRMEERIWIGIPR